MQGREEILQRVTEHAGTVASKDIEALRDLLLSGAAASGAMGEEPYVMHLRRYPPLFYPCFTPVLPLLYPCFPPVVPLF